jgi:TonB family protein
MTNIRYGFSFILSALVYTLLGISLFSLANVPKILKKPEEESIKISIITPPVVKKVIEAIKVPTPPMVIPPKKIIKKKIVKKTIKKKITPKKVIKKVVKKKIIEKPVIQKVQPTKVLEEIKPQPIVEPEPIYYTSSIVPDETYTYSSIVEDTPPMVYNEPQIINNTMTTSAPIYYDDTMPIKEAPIQEVQVPMAQTVIPQTVTQVVPQTIQQTVQDNGAKKAFLNDLRARIIANKEYPQLAKRRHIQGAVDVRFDLTANGEVDNIRFLSGKSILQKGVRKAILRSFPLNIPFEIQNELPMYNISVTVNFNLR